MPFAQYHAPFEEQERFEQRFPADFICEGLDQTRGWFYSLLAISTLLFDRSPYRTVVCHGLLLDEEGRKMSKSRGNVVEPWQLLERFGADAVRWYFFTSRQPWAGYRFSMGTIEESVRQFLLPLWNTYFFYVLYANANALERHPSARAQPDGDLDRWALSRLQATAESVRKRLDDYEATSAGRAIAAFIDELSNWYVRRSRRRFWDGDTEAFATLVLPLHRR
jgi:isoleucyl-tRNA synthetase